MSLELYPAIPADAGRIAEIHMAAFGSNAMLLAQFPTPDVREGLRESIRLKALADIGDPMITVLVVREASPDHRVSDTPGAGDDDTRRPARREDRGGETQAGKVIAFAKWSHPVGKDEEYRETAWVWPPGTDMHVLESWGRAAEAVEERATEGRPCYRLTFMGTDPWYERRGAASMMVRWGLEQCRKHSAPGYLESTLDAAPFYEKMGFVTFGKISLQYRVAGRDGYEIYEEIAFTYWPSSV